MKRCAIGAFILPIVLATSGAAVAEIPHSTTLPSTAQWRDRAVALDMHTASQFESSDPTDSAWHKDAAAFIAAAVRWHRGMTSGPPVNDLERQGRLVYLAGCDDPLVRFLYGEIWEGLGNNAIAEPFVREGANALAKSHYGKVWQLDADAAALRIAQARQHPNEAAHFSAAVAADIHDVLQEKSYGGDRALLAADLVGLMQWMKVPQLRQMWKQAQSVSDADPVALLLIQAELHIELGWQARGGGWAGSVTAKGGAEFSRQLAIAREELQKAWDADPSIPETAVLMMRVAQGNDGYSGMRAWFERAVTARFDKDAAYDQLIWGLYPRWFGDREALLAFGKECLATGRFDTEVPAYFLNVLLAIRNECDAGDMGSWGTPEIYGPAREMFEKSLAPGGVCPGDRRFQSMEATFCMCAGKWADARAALDALGGKLDVRGPAFFGLQPEDVTGPVLAFTGAGAMDALAAQALAAQEKWSDAQGKWADAAAKEQDPVAQRFLRSRQQVAAWEMHFEAGEEVALRGTEELAGFRPAGGSWHAEPGGALTGAAGEGATLSLMCAATFGDHWDFRGQVNFLKTGADWVSSGFTLGAAGAVDLTGGPALMQFSLEPGKKDFVVRDQFMDVVTTQAVAPRKAYSMHIRREGDTLVVSVGEQEVYRGPCSDPEGRLRLGLGGWPVWQQTAVRFSNLRIQKIK